MELGKIKIVKTYSDSMYWVRAVLDTGEEIEMRGEWNPIKLSDGTFVFSTNKKQIFFLTDKFIGDIDKMMYINERGYRDIRPEVRDELARVINDYCVNELKEDDEKIVFTDMTNDKGYPEPGYYEHMNDTKILTIDDILAQGWYDMNDRTKRIAWDKGIRPYDYKEGEPREKYVPAGGSESSSTVSSRAASNSNDGEKQKEM